VGGSRSCCEGRRAYGPHFSFTQGYGALYSLSGFLFVRVVVSVAVMVALVVVVNVYGSGMVCNKWNVGCCSACFDFVIAVTWYYQMTRWCWY